MYFLRLLLIWFVLLPGLRGDALEDFIGNDKELSVLNLDMDDVFNYFEPEMLIAQVDPDDYAEYDNMSPEEINAELVRLRDALQGVYNILLTFARVLASMTTVDFVNLAEELKKNNTLADKMFKDYIINANVQELYSQDYDGVGLGDDGDEDGEKLIAYLSGDYWQEYVQDVKDHDDSDATEADEEDEDGFGDLNDEPDQDFGDLRIYDENGELDPNVDYWDPTDEYNMLVKLFNKEPKDMEVLEKMGLLTLIKKILNKIRAIIKKIKKKIAIILKLIKLKVYIKKIRVVVCLEIMYLIEKIKRLIKLIIQLIKKIIRFLITELPFEILWEIKVVIKFLLRILSDILWEAEIIILEILVKVVKLFKKVKKLASGIVFYFEMTLLQKLMMLKTKVNNKLMFQRMVYYEKVWSGYSVDDMADMSDGSYEANPSDNDDGDAIEVQSSHDIWDYDGTPDIVYGQSDDIYIPEEFLEIFGDVFTEEEMNEYLKGDDAFHFDFVWPAVAENVEAFVKNLEDLEILETKDVDELTQEQIEADHTEYLEGIDVPVVTEERDSSGELNKIIESVQQQDAGDKYGTGLEVGEEEEHLEEDIPILQRRETYHKWVGPDSTGELTSAHLSDEVTNDYASADIEDEYNPEGLEDLSNIVEDEEMANTSNSSAVLEGFAGLTGLDSRLVITALGVLFAYGFIVFAN